MRKWRNLKELAGICELQLSLFLESKSNSSSLSPRVTASKKKCRIFKWRLFNSLLTKLNKRFRPSPETYFRLIQAYNWSKNNFGEIHVSPKGETGRLPLSSIILSWTDGTRHFEVARGDRVEMVVKCIVRLFWGTHFQHCGKFVKTVPQCTLTTNSTRSPAQPQSGEYGMHTNEIFRANTERYGHSRIKERRYDCCSSSYSGIYWLCGIISKLAS